MLLAVNQKGVQSKDNLITLLTKLIQSSLDAYVLVAGNIRVTRTIAAASDDPVKSNEPLTAARQVTFKNCAPFKDCGTEINDTLVDYNLIEYSDNYSDSSGSLWGFKKDEIANNANVTNDDNTPSFKYKYLRRWNKKGSKNSCAIKIFKQFLEIIRNAID